MAYQIPSSRMTLIDLQGTHASSQCKTFQVRFYKQLCSSWQRFNRHISSRRPSALRVVHITTAVLTQWLLRLSALRCVASLVRPGVDPQRPVVSRTTIDDRVKTPRYDTTTNCLSVSR